MGFPTSEVGYTSATTGRGYHEVHKGHVVVLEEEENIRPIFSDQAVRPIGCLQTSVTNYQHTLRNEPKNSESLANYCYLYLTLV
jgi:hypothetical protein